MRLHPELALLVYLCLWIPVAQSQYDATAPEDQDASGDDEEFSGSGSGDIGFTNIFDNFNVPTEASQGTNATWVPEVPVTQQPSTVPPEVDPETPDLIDQVPMVHTTQTPETQSTSSNIIPFVNVKDEVDETTTSHTEVQTESTASPTQKIPVEPTTTALSEDSSDLKETDETTLPANVIDESLYAVGVETTAVPLTTSSASKPTDPEASGDGESTTTRAMTDGSFMEDNLIPDVHKKEETVKDEDFGFDTDNEVKPKSRANEPNQLSSSDNDSLLERKEVLAGVIAGGVVGLAFAIMLVSLMVYRMKKKDEGSYALDEHKHPNGYQKAQRQEEFMA